MAPAAPPVPARLSSKSSSWEANNYTLLPSLDSMSRMASLAGPVSRPAPAPGQSAPLIEPHKLDRLQLSSWALLRSQRSGVAGSTSLASGGQLGASQAGFRLIYNLTRQVALSGRTSSEIGRRGGEVAGGIRVQPLV